MELLVCERDNIQVEGPQMAERRGLYLMPLLTSGAVLGLLWKRVLGFGARGNSPKSAVTALELEHIFLKEIPLVLDLLPHPHPEP